MKSDNKEYLKFYQWITQNVTGEELLHLMFSSNPKLKSKIKRRIKKRVQDKK